MTQIYGYIRTSRRFQEGVPGMDPESQELESIKRRTRDGLERARQQGKVLGPPRKVGPGQLAAMRRMREGGASLRMIASEFECSPSTVMRALRREGVAP